jgi:hypothetical protein
MEKLPSKKDNRAYAAIEREAIRNGQTPDSLIEDKLIEAVGEVEDGDLGSGNVALVEVTGGLKPKIIVHGLVATQDELSSFAALIMRSKKIPKSSTLIPYELVIDDVFEGSIGQMHAVFPKPTMHWVSGRRQ